MARDNAADFKVIHGVELIRDLEPVEVAESEDKKLNPSMIWAGEGLPNSRRVPVSSFPRHFHSVVPSQVKWGSLEEGNPSFPFP
jgi:hypothetical protein